MTKHPDANAASTKRSALPIQPQQLQGAFQSLIPAIQSALEKEGYQTPTPIQEQCIRQLLKGRDMIGCAQTGTGKTAAFTLPLLQRLHENTERPRKGAPRALILAPTRELAAQIGDSIRAYSRFTKISHTVIFGGVSQHRQVQSLRRGVDIVVATPGRLTDLMEQKAVSLDRVDTFILDEVDRMLDMGFIPAIRSIVAKLPRKRQTVFFSATMTPAMERLAAPMLRENPVRITIEPDKPAVERIDQKVLFVRKFQKDELLASLLGDQDAKKVIVFTQMKHVANRVVQQLTKSGIKSSAIHGNKSQTARTKALDSFKKNRIRVLVATDVAARGIDVDDISHVINYDLPVEAETYVHRIGRTARAGAEGTAISFCTFDDRSNLAEIQKLLGKEVPTEADHPFHCEESARPLPKFPGSSTRFQGRRKGGSGRPRRRFSRNRR
ncbi:MAG: DEAD/DEAH box helicase [Verrucomicrobiota bacterium]